MKLFNTPTDFINTLKKTSKVMYQSSNLKAVVDMINCKKEVRIRYSYWDGSNWIPYGSCCSPYLVDVINDFSNEQKLYDNER